MICGSETKRANQPSHFGARNERIPRRARQEAFFYETIIVKLLYNSPTALSTT